MITFTSKLLRALPLATDVFQYDFDFGGQSVDFFAGQFFMMKVQDGKEPVVNRSYSISSSPSVKDQFSLCIKLIEGGRASEYLRTMKPGDSVEYMGPTGHFYFRDEDKDILMIATGTGLAPFMGMIPYAYEQGFKHKIDLFFGVRHQDDLFYVKELEDWAAEHSSFTPIITLSQPEESWTGAKGRVTDYFTDWKGDPQKTVLYICGNGDMVKAVRAMALEKGFPKENIRLELFTTF